MTPELKQILEEWLISDDPIQQAHAKARLAMEEESPEEAAARAAALTAEFPPENPFVPIGKPCGVC